MSQNSTMPTKSKKQCAVCHKMFYTSYPTSMTCSSECHKERMKSMSGRKRQFNISSASVGAISELEVGADLLKKGYSVFRALSSSCFCDLIAIKENKVLKLEVRTGYRSKIGSIAFSNAVHGEIDGFAIYIPEDNSIHYFQNTHNVNRDILKI